MLSEHETMCYAHCGQNLDGNETLVRIDSDNVKEYTLKSDTTMNIEGTKLNEITETINDSIIY